MSLPTDPPAERVSPVKAMVVGFPADAMRALTHELRLAGHHVLGAVGKQGAWTFLRAAPWDLVLVPLGPEGERARAWVDELGLGLPTLAVPEGRDALEWLGRHLRGEPAEPPAPEPPPPELEPSEPPGPSRGEPPAGADREDSLEASPPEVMAQVLSESPAEAVPASPTRKKKRPERPGDADAEAPRPHPDLASKLAQVRFGDYHSILEVEPNASPYATREQRDRLAFRYSPRGWPARLSPEELDMLDEIARGVADAWLVLGDPELAARYERALSQASSRTLANGATIGYAGPPGDEGYPGRRR